MTKKALRKPIKKKKLKLKGSSPSKKPKAKKLETKIVSGMMQPASGMPV